MTQGGTIIATYTYNALNQRIGIKDNGTQTWTVYDGNERDAHPYADFNGSGSLTMRYLSAPGVFNGTLTSVILARTSSERNDRMVPDRPVGLGAGHREYIGNRARPHRL